MNIYDLEINRQDLVDQPNQSNQVHQSGIPQVLTNGVIYDKPVYLEPPIHISPEQSIPIQYQNLGQPIPPYLRQYHSQPQFQHQVQHQHQQPQQQPQQQPPLLQPQSYQPPNYNQFQNYQSYNQDKYVDFGYTTFDSGKTRDSKDQRPFELEPEHATSEIEYQIPSSSSSFDDRKPAKSNHNIIEQRYRNKINTKFQVLQNLVPSLRYLTNKKGKKNNIIEDLEGLEPARKLNKGTILSKSIEYIEFLESKNQTLKQENQYLKQEIENLKLEKQNSISKGNNNNNGL